MNQTTEFRISDRFGKMLWPVADITGWQFYNLPDTMLAGDWVHPASLPYHIMELCDNKSLVIQAGGNSGLYAKIYAEHFSQVMTCEPDNVWFKCLVENAQADNIFKFQCILGNNQSPVSLKLNYDIPGGKDNLAAMKVDSVGIIPQMTIDSLNVNPDLIHLDIEGYEGFAIEGAIETIQRCSPIIVVETNDSGNEYFYPKEKVHSLLLSLGYYLVKSWGHDALYKRQ